MREARREERGQGKAEARARTRGSPQARLGPRSALGFPSSDSPPSSCHHVVDSYVHLARFPAPRRADQPLPRPAPPCLCSALPSSSSSPPSSPRPVAALNRPGRRPAEPMPQVCTPRAVSRASSAASATSAPTPTSSRSRASPTPRRLSSTSARLAFTPAIRFLVHVGLWGLHSRWSEAGGRECDTTRRRARTTDRLHGGARVQGRGSRLVFRQGGVPGQAGPRARAEGVGRGGGHAGSEDGML